MVRARPSAPPLLGGACMVPWETEGESGLDLAALMQRLEERSGAADRRWLHERLHQLLRDPVVNPHGARQSLPPPPTASYIPHPSPGSVPIEKIENLLRFRESERFIKALGPHPRRPRAFHKVVSAAPDVVLFAVGEGQERVRLLAVSDWQTRDALEEAQRLGQQERVLGRLERYLDRGWTEKKFEAGLPSPRCCRATRAAVHPGRLCGRGGIRFAHAGGPGTAGEAATGPVRVRLGHPYAPSSLRALHGSCCLVAGRTTSPPAPHSRADDLHHGGEGAPLSSSCVLAVVGP